MKFSWGVGITLTYVIFISSVVGIVIYMHTIDVNLVRDDYYEQELKHQDKIDKQTRSQALSENVQVKLDSVNLNISFPSEFKSYEVDGMLTVFRPSDREMDKTIKIDCNEAMIHKIPIAQLQKGVWRIKVDWQARNNTYYDEKIIMIN
jgi:hypothetical protein